MTHLTKSEYAALLLAESAAKEMLGAHVGGPHEKDYLAFLERLRQVMQKIKPTRQRRAPEYARIKRGHPAYERVTELKRLGGQACDSVDHNDDGGCSNPDCFKHKTPAAEISSCNG
jgi:hypothetical protein